MREDVTEQQQHSSSSSSRQGPRLLVEVPPPAVWWLAARPASQAGARKCVEVAGLIMASAGLVATPRSLSAPPPLPPLHSLPPAPCPLFASSAGRGAQRRRGQPVLGQREPVVCVRGGGEPAHGAQGGRLLLWFSSMTRGLHNDVCNGAQFGVYRVLLWRGEPAAGGWNVRVDGRAGGRTRHRLRIGLMLHG